MTLLNLQSYHHPTVTMALVIRFNTILVRKSSIETKYPSGLQAYRARYLPGNAQFYCEDLHLVAHSSMSGFDDVEERLVANGLRSGQGCTSADSCGASQADGVEGNCDWLETRSIAGGLVCWLRELPPGFITDYKTRRFVHRVGDTNCPRCGIIFGMGAAASAVDYDERRLGPLKVMSSDCLGADAYVVWCSSCNEETVFTSIGTIKAQTSSSH